MPTTAIIYARFSTAEQSKGFSLERQSKLGLEFAAGQGWQVERTITDEGRSAFHGANRLEGSALHHFELEAKNGLHDGKVLVVENIDRLSRQGPKAAAQLIWGLNEHGVDVATYHDEQIYKASGSGDLLDVFKLIISAQQSHQESANKSKRTSATWTKRFKAIADGTQAKPVPHTPVWIDRTENGFALNKRRSAVLNEIFDLYIDGVGIHRIVTMLNARDEPVWTAQDHDRAKNGWFYSYIWRLLTKRAVLGEYVTLSGQTLASDFFPQAIGAEKWNRAQAALTMRKGNQKTTKTQGNRNLLSQTVFCDQCGGGAHFRHQIDRGQSYRRKNGEVVTYKRNDNRRLRCDKAGRKHACDNGTILSYDVVEAAILNEMLPRLVDRSDENNTASRLRAHIAELIRQREAEQNRLDNLIDALADGGSKAIVQRIASLENNIQIHSSAIEAAERQLAVETSTPSSADDVTLIAKLRGELTSDDDEVRVFARGRVNMTLRRLIKRIVITNTGGFRVEPDESSWWLFDEEGALIEGAYAA